ncbi:substrate-binding periplasmic protein [Agarivorans sp. MS3-6]|uniref:substrate-binding periplasmic protein n=1 Tax=Agarivorans sp. TSD2052 TaxID=2937286 RepID=UPI00200EEE43|nr:transporter substrate-binding domain-containing protein [Agarivorans sp. TSD2052]UPW19399.1 transporter substrate-binding domain-containing protein [Agarivorans sp. TSD2052]
MIQRFVVLGCLLCWPVLAQQTLTTANAHWPPWRELEPDGRLSGIEIDILTELSQRLGLQLETKGCGWKRCLKHMVLGESDVMTGLLKTAEREQYMAFIDPPYRSKQSHCFYLHRGTDVELNSYQDLSSITVGLQSKVAYFERFDNDDSISKHEAIDDVSLFRLLKGDRVDTVIMSCIEGDNFLKQQGLSQWFKHAHYVEYSERNVYLAVSKQSPLLQRRQEISTAIQSMLDSGEISAILNQHKLEARD